MKSTTFKCSPIISTDIFIKKETANIWEYKFGNMANIANFMRLWKTRMGIFSTVLKVRGGNIILDLVRISHET